MKNIYNYDETEVIGQEREINGFMDSINFLHSGDSFDRLSNEELDICYFHVFGRLAWHMSREGYIHSLMGRRSQIILSAC